MCTHTGKSISSFMRQGRDRARGQNFMYLKVINLVGTAVRVRVVLKIGVLNLVRSSKSQVRLYS